MSIFSRNEIERRMETLRSNLAGHDAGVFFSFTNSYYMSGVPILPWGRPGITVIPKNDEPVIISGKADEQNILSNSPIQNVITYGDIDGPNVNEAISHLADVIHRLKLEKIGFDGLYTPFAYIEMLKAKRPHCQFTDISDMVEKMRLINSDEEICYKMFVSENGYLYVHRGEDTLVEHKLSQHIRLYDHPNQWAIVMDGSNFEIYCNGELLSTFSDSKYERGDFGFGVLNSEDDQWGFYGIAFDNIRVSSLE